MRLREIAFENHHSCKAAVGLQSCEHRSWAAAAVVVEEEDRIAMDDVVHVGAARLEMKLELRIDQPSPSAMTGVYASVCGEM